MFFKEWKRYVDCRLVEGFFFFFFFFLAVPFLSNAKVGELFLKNKTKLKLCLKSYESRPGAI